VCVCVCVCGCVRSGVIDMHACMIIGMYTFVCMSVSQVVCDHACVKIDKHDELSIVKFSSFQKHGDDTPGHEGAIQVYVYMYICAYVYMSVCVCVCVCCIRACVYAYICIYVYVYVYLYLYIYTHTHARTYI